MRLLKTLSLALGIVGVSVLSILFASCGSGKAQYRVVDTIAGLPFNIDIDVNVATPVATTPTYQNVSLGEVEPASGYAKIDNGSNPIVAFQTATLTQVVAPTNLNLSSNQYTVLLLGLGAGVANNEAVVLTDNNAAPASGDGEFRIVNGAPESPGGSVDIYLVPPGTPITGIAPDASAILYGQPSAYVSKTAATYSMIVTAQGSKIPQLTENYALSAGQIYTVVLIDNSSGGFPGIPVLLTDVQ
jgi:hypothetical protein